MKLKNLRFCLTIMLLIASLIPIVTAPSIQPEPIDSNDDAFITGVGNYFGDTPYLFLRDQTTSLLIGTRFRNVAIPQGEKINNATLYVRSIYDYPAAGDIRVTIRGDDIDDSLAFNDSGSFTRTYTSAYVVWNISEVNGNAWHNVTVTNIVQEIIDRVGWQSGNDLSLLFWAIKGTPRREFASVDGNPAYAAYIDINYGIPPPPDEIEDIQDDAETPYNETVVYEWEYNDTYRGIDIFIVSEINTWLNFSEYTVWGAASGKVTNLNDTYFDLDLYYGGSFLRMYKDWDDDDGSGIVGRKWGIRYTHVATEPPPASGRLGLVGWTDDFEYVSASTSKWQDGYIFHLFVENLVPDESRIRVSAIRDGVIRDTENAGDLYEVSTPYTHYYDFILNMDRTINTAEFTMKVYNDLAMTSLNSTYSEILSSTAVYVQGQYQYEYLIAGWHGNIPGPDPTVMSGAFLSDPDPDLDSVIFLVYPNGTLVDPDPLDPDEDPYDEIDDLLGGAQPEDPEPEEYKVIDKFRWKLLVLCIGMIMMVGSPLAGVVYGADTATWIKLLFVAFFGLGILWQINYM
jgi:hypothetical protein